MDLVEAEPRSSSGAIVVAALVAALVAGGAGYWFAASRSAAAPTPDSNSAEAGFARDMQVHHLQGVELAMMVRDRSEDPEMRRFAYDMATTQSHQAGQLYGWLAAWHLPQFGAQTPMTWMGHTMPRGALMPGMATPEQVQMLGASSGVDAERIFLRLMITHHRGALEMSKAVLERSQRPEVVAFARGVLTSQQSEIDLMTKMLEKREAPGL